MIRKKSTSRAKQKAASLEEILQKWKENFKNLLGNPAEVTDKHEKIINSQVDIQLGQFTEEELEVVLKELKADKQ